MALGDNKDILLVVRFNYNLYLTKQHKIGVYVCVKSLQVQLSSIAMFRNLSTIGREGEGVVHTCHCTAYRVRNTCLVYLSHVDRALQHLRTLLHITTSFEMRILNILTTPMDTSQHQIFTSSLKRKSFEKVNKQVLTAVNFTLFRVLFLLHHPSWPLTPQL